MYSCKRVSLFSVLLMVVVFIVSCGSEHSTNNAVPSLSSISPTSAPAGSAAFTLTVNGTGFVSASTVQWNGIARPTVFVSSTQLTASIPAADIAASGVATVTVNSPAPGGGISSAANFTIQAPNPTPTISTLSPGSAIAGTAAFTLTANGTGFVSSSTVEWNGAARTTTFVSATQLTAAITAADIATAGTGTVTVRTPAPGGGVTAGTTFTIQSPNPVPTVSTLAPTSAVAGGPAFTLTVNGTGFINGSTVLWSGSTRTTTYVSATQLTAAIASVDIASAGTSNIAVRNPAPGGGTSSTATFTINAPAAPLATTALAPATTIVGSTAFTLVVTGTGFVNGATVQWAGSPRTTTFVSSTQLTAAITAADVSAQGSFDVTVQNPDDSISNPTAFTVNAITAGVFARIPASTGAEPHGDSAWPILTPDGRYVVYAASGTDVFPGDTNGFIDIVERDTCYGASASCVPSTTLVSVATDGTQGNGHAYALRSLAVTPDGRYVAFQSAATNMVANDTNNQIDLFLRDTCIGASAGCTPSTILVSVATDGTQGNSPSGDHPTISADGRYVAFNSNASNINLVGSSAVALRDTCIGAPVGCTPSLSILSKQPGDPTQPWTGARPSMTPDARYIAYDDSGNGVYLVNTCIGEITPCTQTASLVSSDSNGLIRGYEPSISADGRVITYTTYSSTGRTWVADTCMGAPVTCVPVNYVISNPTDGSAADNSVVNESGVSPDGRYAAFTSLASNLVAGDTNNVADLFVFDDCIGASGACTPSLKRASIAYNGAQTNAVVYVSSHAITLGGKLIVFCSTANNLVPGDFNNNMDSFIAYTGY